MREWVTFFERMSIFGQDRRPRLPQHLLQQRLYRLYGLRRLARWGDHLRQQRSSQLALRHDLWRRPIRHPRQRQHPGGQQYLDQQRGLWDVAQLRRWPVFKYGRR
jgi:hypothetical protein